MILPASLSLANSAEARGVVLTWNAVPNALRYELMIWWDGAPDWKPIVTPTPNGTPVPSTAQ